MISTTTHSTPRGTGQSLVELMAGSIVLIPIVLFAIDLATVYMGQSMNSTICRDAARAAAAGPPSSISPTLTPKQRAEAVVHRTQKAEGAIRIDPDVVVEENVVRTPTLPFGGLVEGTVKVQTAVDVYPPFILGHCVSKGAVRISAAQTYPFTWVMASAYNAPQTLDDKGLPGMGSANPVSPQPVGAPLPPPPEEQASTPPPVAPAGEGEGGGDGDGAPPAPTGGAGGGSGATPGSAPSSSSGPMSGWQ